MNIYAKMLSLLIKIAVNLPFITMKNWIFIFL